MEEKMSLFKKIKLFLIGGAHNPYDTNMFHKLSLIAFFAWVGLGADGLSSSCYGPPEAFLALGKHVYLSIFVALASALTILIISASYSQIIELFPSGGGGYLVASKLLSPNVGMVSGCALLIDYVLTITVSVASGTEAIFSFLPVRFLPYRLEFDVAVLAVLIMLNLRGIKESVLPLVPIFLAFVVTHAFVIIYAVAGNMGNVPHLFSATAVDVRNAHAEIGLLGMFFVMMRAYSMGAGTYTGIEAVSNGMNALREPKVKTAKHTMSYMAISLTVTVVGLMVAYLIYNVSFQPGKTLNAVLFEKVTANWGNWGYTFVLITLFSEATLLYVAAQTGFLDGPRVLANMSLDRWFPSRFAMLTDRFVSQNGILIMGLSAIVIMLFAHGSVTFMIVLYSINVFITFSLSQLGMVRHWWAVRANTPGWHKKIAVNGIGLLMTSFILIMMIVMKFNEGGWITLLVTTALVLFAVYIRRQYRKTLRLLHRLDSLVRVVEPKVKETGPETVHTVTPQGEFDPAAKTAVIFVSGFNGLGLHTLFGIVRLFEGVFKNFIFVQIGIIDAGNFKGCEQVEELENHCRTDVNKYVNYVRSQGFNSEGISVIGTDVVAEIEEIAPRILEKFPNVIFFGGQLVFPENTFISRWLHNYTVFLMQRIFYSKGIPFVLLPIKV